MYKLYVLKSKSAKKSYVGITNDIGRRLKEHNAGKHFYTKRYIPWEVIYTEDINGLDEAHKRERYFKSTSGRRVLKTIFSKI